MATDGAIGLADALSLDLDEVSVVCAEIEQINRKRAAAIQAAKEKK
ncbi:hypothetical protein [Lysobacter sp. GCM10012299]